MTTNVFYRKGGIVTNNDQAIRKGLVENYDDFKRSNEYYDSLMVDYKEAIARFGANSLQATAIEQKMITIESNWLRVSDKMRRMRESKIRVVK